MGHPSSTYALVADLTNHRVRRVDIPTGKTTTLAGSTKGFSDGLATNARFNHPFGIAIDPSGSFALVTDSSNSRVRRIDLATGDTRTLVNLPYPYYVAIDPSGTFALVTANRAVHRVNIATGATTTLAGVVGTGGFSDGVGTSARFTNLYGVAIHPSGAFALVVDSNSIRHVE